MNDLMRIDSATLVGFEPSGDPGCFEIADREFDNQGFSQISIGPGLPPERFFCVRNTRFRRCVVSPGEFVIRGGVELTNVEFDSVSSRDSLIISTNSVLNGVSIRGAIAAGGLWIRPDEVLDQEKYAVRQRWVAQRSSDIDVFVDFTQFDCENIEVVGLPLDKLRFNHDLHVAIREEWRHRVDLSGFPPAGFFRNALRRLKTYGAAEGVFASPRRNSHRWSEFRREAELLLAVGIDLRGEGRGACQGL